ncbi:MAG: hypothetical protein H6773_04525 [Pseudomonadales bacterium]|nr:hypothetical protein [Candidatus Woesebacteria bacterium]MCB9801422.1 hypothetical protein [Pseudomonadales bacterium]
MQKAFFSFLILTLISFFVASQPIVHTSYAAGTEKTNDVVLQQDGDVLFLSTTATHSAERTATTAAASKSRSQSLFQRLAETTITIPKGFATNITNLLNAILSMVMLIGSLLVFLQLILAGFFWITSGGDKGKVDAARQRITAAIIGLIVVASSFAILTLGLNFLGFESLEDVFKNTKTIS